MDVSVEHGATYKAVAVKNLSDGSTQPDSGITFAPSGATIGDFSDNGDGTLTLVVTGNPGDAGTVTYTDAGGFQQTDNFTIQAVPPTQTGITVGPWEKQ